MTADQFSVRWMNTSTLLLLAVKGYQEGYEWRISLNALRDIGKTVDVNGIHVVAVMRPRPAPSYHRRSRRGGRPPAKPPFVRCVLAFRLKDGVAQWHHMDIGTEDFRLLQEVIVGEDQDNELLAAVEACDRLNRVDDDYLNDLFDEDA